MESLFGIFVVLLMFASITESTTKAICRIRDIITNVIHKTSKKNDFDKVVFMIFAMALAMMGHLGLLGFVWKSVLGEIPYHIPEHLDYLLTGLLIARGSNPVHDLFKKFKGWTTQFPTGS